ncbi:MAG: carboxypeptidase regulatory-like domain-containing protein [Acidobacteriota bacterium]
MFMRDDCAPMQTFTRLPVLRRLGLLAVSAVMVACGGTDSPPPQEERLRDSPAAPPSAPAASSGTGILSGRMTLVGAPPAVQEIEVTKDQQVCGAHAIVKEDLLVGPRGGLENVVVSLAGVPAGGAANLPDVELHQKGCVFQPHVAVVAVGRPLPVFNDDGILHNIHTFSTINPRINKAQPKFKKRLEIQLDEPETIRVTCDAHPWMQSWIIVSDHPYVAVSDEEGYFRIDGVPAGIHRVRLWHETLGEQSQEVNVQAGQTTEIAVEFSQGS